MLADYKVLNVVSEDCSRYREQRCYEKSGFYVDGEPYDKVTLIGKGLFYRMQL